MGTYHKLIIGNSMNMKEINDNSVQLMVTSPPYFNAPFDYKDLFKGYGQYLGFLHCNSYSRAITNISKCISDKQCKREHRILEMCSHQG